MSAKQWSNNPYIGPRPFETEHQNLFFGREREVKEFYAHAISNRVVVFHAQSGTGKTSLLNAGLIPLLEAEPFQILPPTRVRGLIPEEIPFDKVNNPYVLNSLFSWAAEETEPATLLDRSIKDFLSKIPHEKDKYDLDVPRLIIFDQFEELFRFYPERWHQRENFFEQVRDALQDDEFLRVIFIIREDYLAQIDPYDEILIEHVSLYRIEHMQPRAAKLAIARPLEGTGRSFAPSVEDRLLEELAQIRVETQSGEMETATGQFIEPVQLQVVCQLLWDSLPDDVTVIDETQLKQFGNVDQALGTFYENAITATVEQTKDVSEDELRSWFGNQLITSAETRGTVFQEHETTGGIPNGAITVLENLHLIRSEIRSGGRWYELTHDRFIQPILESNSLWYSAQEQVEQTKIIKEKDEKIKGLQRVRQLSQIIVAMAAIIIVTLIIAAINIQSSRQEAEAHASTATVAQGVAQIAANDAANERDNAGTQAAIAETNAAAANIAEEQQSDLAQIYSLVTNSRRMLNGNNPSLALSLALETLNYTSVPLPIDAEFTISLAAYNYQVRRQFFGHTQRVASVAINPNGETALSASSDQTVILWDVSSGEILHIFEGHTDRVWEVAFSPDGSMAVSGGEDGLRLWDIDNRSLIHDFDGYHGFVRSIAFHPDGEHILSGGINEQRNRSELRLWNIEAEQAEWTSSAHRDLIYAVAISPDGTRALSGDGSGLIWYWDVGNGEQLIEDPFDYHDERSISRRINSIAFNSDGTQYVSAADDSNIVFIDLETANGFFLTGHFQPVQRAIFGPNDATILSGSVDNSLILWDLTTGQPVRSYNAHEDTVRGIAFTPDGHNFISASSDTTLILWDIEPGSVIRRIRAQDRVSSVTYSLDGQFVLVASGHEFSLIDIDSGDQFSTMEIDEFFMDDTDNDGEFKEVENTINSVAHHPIDHLALTGSSDGIVRLWDLERGINILEMNGHNSSVNIVEFSPDGAYAISGSSNPYPILILWDLQSGEEVRRFEGHIRDISGAAFSPDGAMIASASADTLIKLWDVSSGNEIRSFQTSTDFVFDVEFTSDGEYLLSAGDDGTLTLWDVDTSLIQQRFVGHTGRINHIDIGSNDEFVLSASSDNTVILWNLNTGDIVRQFESTEGVNSLVTAVAFSPEGQSFVSGSIDGSIILWRIDTFEDLVNWIYQNRYISELTCLDYADFTIQPPPLCEGQNYDFGLTPTPIR